MKVLVLFTNVPDVDAMSRADWEVDGRFFPETRFVMRQFGPYDESALELALSLRDKAAKVDLEMNLTALTVFGEEANPFLSTLFALRFDECIRIEPDNLDLRFRPELTASLIEAYISKNQSFDLIFAGCRSADGGNAAVPLILAEKLGIACITHVSSISPTANCELEIVSQHDGGEIFSRLIPPLVITVGNAPSAYLRVPTLRERIAFGKRESVIFSASELLVDKPAAQWEICAAYPFSKTRESLIVDGATPREKAKAVYENCLKGRL